MASRKSIGTSNIIIVTQHFDTHYFCGVHSAFLVSSYMELATVGSMYKEIQNAE